MSEIPGPGGAGSTSTPDSEPNTAGTQAQPAGPQPQPASPWAPSAPTPQPTAQQQSPAEQQPTEQQPTGQQQSPAAQQPTEQQPTGQQQPAAQQPTAQQPTAQQPTAQQPAYAWPYAQPPSPYAAYGQAPGSYGQPGATPAVPPASPYDQTNNPLATPGTETPKASRSRATKITLAALATVALSLTSGAVGGVVGYSLHPDSTGPLQTTAAAPADPAPVIDRSSLASIAAAVQPTVVSVTTQVGEGSGVVISEDGYIITNNHVVSGAQSVRVTFNSGRQLPVSVVGTDPKTDIAVLKADVTGLKTATWGDSESVQVGDTVLAIGSPLGLQGSVTAGIVSALHRVLVETGENQFGSRNAQQTTIGDAIQTDAPINPGNSGGALVNTDAEVIGINAAIYATSQSSGNIGVGFAIPANRAKAVAEQLINGGSVSHPYLGVSVGDAENGGALIGEVVSGSPADTGGLKVGDVVTKIGDRTISTSDDLVGAIQSSTVGQSLQLRVLRNGAEETVTVTVGEQP